MSEDNPYRFSGDADAASAFPPDDSPGTYVRPSGPPILSPQEIRRLAFDRGWFALAVLLVFGWALLTFYLIPRQVAEALIPFPTAVRRTVSITSFLAHLPAMVFAYRMQAFSNRSRLAAAVLAALLLMPFVKYLLAFLLLNDSRQILLRHGIRMALLKAEHGSLPGSAFASREEGREASSERS
jgi:hypothetical protein